MTSLYTKQGRRYIPYGTAEAYSADLMSAGTCRMTYCYTDGSTRYSYEVKPDTASFVAACELASEAMERAINERSRPTPSAPTPYTKRQREIIDQFARDMTAAGGLMPGWWTHSSAREIAQAGINAVRTWGEK